MKCIKVAGTRVELERNNTLSSNCIRIYLKWTLSQPLRHRSEKGTSSLRASKGFHQTDKSNTHRWYPYRSVDVSSIDSKTETEYMKTDLVLGEEVLRLDRSMSHTGDQFLDVYQKDSLLLGLGMRHIGLVQTGAKEDQQ